MMEFLKLTEDYRVVLEPWLVQVPEFSKIIKADKGSEGDYRGDKKLKATRQLAYVYYMCDFKSPIGEYEQEEKEFEARRYTDVTDDEITPDVRAAMDYWEEHQIKAARSLKTLKVMKASLDKMDSYFTDVDFSKTDKQGKLLHTTKDYIGNIATVNKVYEGIDIFEKRVMAELKAPPPTARAGKQLGGKEGNRKQWSEGGNPLKAGVNMSDIEDTAVSVSKRFEHSDSAELDTDEPVPDEDGVVVEKEEDQD